MSEPTIRDVIAEAERLLATGVGDAEWFATDDGRVIDGDGFEVLTDTDCDEETAEFIGAAPRLIRRLLAALAAPPDRQEQPVEKLRRAVEDRDDARTRLSESPYASNPNSIGHTFISNQIAHAEDRIEAAIQELIKAAPVPQGERAPDDCREKYHELLWAVSNKYPGESRHDTALRYIREAEGEYRTGSATAQATLTREEP